MHLSRVKLRNWRNYESLDLSLHQGFVVFVGDNSAGKTNLLEGIYFGASLRRFPESKPPQLLQEGKGFLKVYLEANFPELTTQEVFAEKVENRLVLKIKLLNQTVSKKAYTRHLPVISFLPQDLILLTRSPANRRRYLNEALTAGSVEYAHQLTQYKKTLEQRNKVLIQGLEENLNLSSLEIWDGQLATFGSAIIAERDRFIVFLNSRLPQVMAGLSPELQAGEFLYQESGNISTEGYLKELFERRKQDQQLGTSTMGPHRDDFRFMLQGQDAVGYLSRGQMRAVTLALKILEKDYLEDRLHLSPLLLLDDVFSEFDHAHQLMLVEFLQTLPQVLLTTTHFEQIHSFLPQKSFNYQVTAGEITLRV